ncbi:restriction endonuclease subunit S [Rheinheimera sp.]|uniref:restriction endonuclease subunit S n=1 Tax=Rheinheimera sp. TaxID=1869214 RepID=UPI003AF5FA46
MSLNTTDHYWSLIQDRWPARAHLKWLAKIYSGATPSRENAEYWAEGVHPWIGSGEVNQGLVTDPTALISDLAVQETSTKLMRKGALIIALAGQGRTKGTVAQLGIDCFGNQSLSCIDARNDDDRFLFWWLTSLYRQIRGLASDDSRDGLNQEMVGSIPIPIVDISIQRVIANYLDRETARIDGLIAEKQRMLELLEEKRAALFSHVVTRGLDPEVPLKPSCQEWLGEIPAHWRVERAKNLFTVRDERSDDGSEELLTVSHITGVTSRSEKDVYMFEADDKAGYKRCMPGDLAINTLWAWMGAMGISPLAGIVSPDYHVYTSKGELLPEYVDLLCRSLPFVAEVSRWSKGVWSSRLRLYPENFFEMRLPVPPHDEQAAIVRAVKVDQRKANALRESLQLSISLANERRAALITAAVTGQIPLEEMTG